MSYMIPSGSVQQVLTKLQMKIFIINLQSGLRTKTKKHLGKFEKRMKDRKQFFNYRNVTNERVQHALIHVTG